MTHEERKKRREEVLELARLGMDGRDISSKVGLSPAYVRNILTDIITRVDRRSAIKGFNSYAVIADLLHDGMTFQQIADKNGISRQRVQQVHARCVEAGIPVTERKRGLVSKK